MSSKKNSNGLQNILLNVVIPSLIMTKFSTEEYLGAKIGVLVAISFPLAFGLFSYIQEKRINFLSAIGLMSVLLTGGVGIFGLSKNVIIAKETLIPFTLGVIVLISSFGSKPLIYKFLESILQIELVKESFDKVNGDGSFMRKIKFMSYLGFGIFMISATLNFFLAIYILKGEPGSVEFTESLGKMTAFSFPIIGVPLIGLTIIVFFYLFRILKNAGINYENFVKR